jgi:nitrate/nitrite transporter NarK
MKKSTTGLLIGSALVVGLSGCASSASQSPSQSSASSDGSWYQHPLVCGLAGSVIGGSIGYATSSSSDEESGAATGAAAGAAVAVAVAPAVVVLAGGFCAAEAEAEVEVAAPLPDVYAQLEAMVIQQKQQELISQFTEKLRVDAEIEIFI